MKKYTLHPAFTLIEILVSVLILSGSIVYALKIHSQNYAQIHYISERGKLSLQDSLFLAEDATRYNKDVKEAYDVLHRYFKVHKDKSREILKKIKREYEIPDPIVLSSDEEGGMPAATIQSITIKDKYASHYFHFNLNGF